MQLEMQVATPAPSMMPKPVAVERPVFRSRFESALKSTVVTPPATIMHMAYCHAYAKVCSSATSMFNTERMNRPISSANGADTSRPRYIEKVLTRLASTSLPCPSRSIPTSRQPPQGWRGRLLC